VLLTNGERSAVPSSGLVHTSLKGINCCNYVICLNVRHVRYVEWPGTCSGSNVQQMAQCCSGDKLMCHGSSIGTCSFNEVVRSVIRYLSTISLAIECLDSCPDETNASMCWKLQRNNELHLKL
jgi:hypothetical protein